MSVVTTAAPRTELFFRNPTRRDMMKSLGAAGAAALTAPTGLVACATAQTATGLVYPLKRGPYQNNGATPWFSPLPLGTPGQSLKFGLDTGSNFIWVTSSLCAESGNACPHYGGLEFNYGQSSSFTWVDRTDKNVDFGPWGTMVVETGRDLIGTPNGRVTNTTLYLSKDYSGSQFAQLDWDGGIGFPSGSQYAQPGVSFYMQDLFNAGIIDPEYPYISFVTDYAAGVGSCRLGGVDSEAFDPSAGIFMPWSPYTGLPGVEYLWTTNLSQYVVGSQTVATNAVFSLDSGSSRFKGDDTFMNTTLSIIAAAPQKPDVTLHLGRSVSGGIGQITLPPSVYEVTIEAGPDAGQTLPQFHPLGIPNMVLVGSVLMDLFYTIFEYDVQASSMGYTLKPVGMWLFNKTGDGDFIRSRSEKPAPVGIRKPVNRG